MAAKAIAMIEPKARVRRRPIHALIAGEG